MAAKSSGGKRKRPSNVDIEIRKIEARHSIASTFISNGFKWSSLFGIAYWVYRSIEVLAGKMTLTDISFALLANSKFTCALGGILGIGGVIYGRRQANLRKSTVERLHPFQEAYERNLDPKRTSSSLTSRGDTRTEDQ